MLLGLAGWIIFAAAVVRVGADPAFLPLLICGFLVFLTGILTLLFGLRCGRCGENLGHTLAWPPSLFRIPARIRCCPFCGADLDAAA